MPYLTRPSIDTVSIADGHTDAFSTSRNAQAYIRPATQGKKKLQASMDSLDHAQHSEHLRSRSFPPQFIVQLQRRLEVFMGPDSAKLTLSRPRISA